MIKCPNERTWNLDNFESWQSLVNTCEKSEVLPYLPANNLACQFHGYLQMTWNPLFRDKKKLLLPVIAVDKVSAISQTWKRLAHAVGYIMEEEF